MRRTSVLAAPAVVRVHQDALEPASDLGSMTRLFLLLTVTASAASAQASPEGATSSAAVWIESGGGFGYVLEPGDDAGWDVLGGALRLGVAPAGGPLFTEVGVVGWYEFWGRDELVGGHVSVGGRWAVGSLSVSTAAGPSVLRVSRSERDDPSFAARGARIVPGVHARAQAVLSIIPPVSRGPGIGLGFEVTAHVTGPLSTAGIGPTLVIGRLPRAVLPPPRP